MQKIPIWQFSPTHNKKTTYSRILFLFFTYSLNPCELGEFLLFKAIDYMIGREGLEKVIKCHFYNLSFKAMFWSKAAQFGDI